MEKNKKIAVVFAAVLLVAAMSACSTHSSKSYTFKVETGDKIKIEMDTSGDYSFAQEEGRFRVEKGEDEILQGMFMTKEGYDQYQTLKDSKEVKILADGEKTAIHTSSTSTRERPERKPILFYGSKIPAQVCSSEAWQEKKRRKPPLRD